MDVADGTGHLNIAVAKSGAMQSVALRINKGMIVTDFATLHADEKPAKPDKPVKRFRLQNGASDSILNHLDEPTFLKLVQSGGLLIVEPSFYERGRFKFAFTVPPAPTQESKGVIVMTREELESQVIGGLGKK
jgi:hypothetical protein